MQCVTGTRVGYRTRGYAGGNVPKDICFSTVTDGVGFHSGVAGNSALMSPNEAWRRESNYMGFVGLGGNTYSDLFPFKPSFKAKLC